jgi:hypothetical protein
VEFAMANSPRLRRRKSTNTGRRIASIGVAIAAQIVGLAVDDGDSWRRVRMNWLISSHAAHQPVKIGDFLVQ